MGKLTISMAIFNSYVSLPEGRSSFADSLQAEEKKKTASLMLICPAQCAMSAGTWRSKVHSLDSAGYACKGWLEHPIGSYDFPWFPRPGAIEPLGFGPNQLPNHFGPWRLCDVVCNLGSSDLSGWVQPHCGWSNHEAWWLCGCAAGISWLGLKVHQLQSTKPPVFQTFLHRIGWWENLQESPMNLMVKTMVSGEDFPNKTNPLISRLFRVSGPWPRRPSRRRIRSTNTSLSPSWSLTMKKTLRDVAMMQTWGPTSGKRGPRRPLDFRSHDWISRFCSYIMLYKWKYEMEMDMISHMSHIHIDDDKWITW